MLVLLLRALRGDRCGTGGGGLGVEVVRGLRRAEVVVELVHERDARRDVEARDVVVGDAVEVLHERAERVAVRRDEDGLPLAEVLRDVRLPVRQQAVDHELQRLRAGQLVAELGVATVPGLRPLGVVGDGGRRDVERPTPLHELLLAVLLERLGLVLALQVAVVALVEAPVALHRQPGQVGLEQRDVGGLDRPGQQRRVQDVRDDARPGDELAGALRLLLAQLAESDVDPAGEQVLLVPVTVAVTQQDERGGHAPSLPSGCASVPWAPCPSGTSRAGPPGSTGSVASTGGSRRCRRSGAPPTRSSRTSATALARRPPSSSATGWRGSVPTSR
ncbi:hypothetical protein Cus16_2904 [Curtobacterium sp. ER1/6]|nr:hypothetical protein Cus16_2904 [Curtobacterium sp. ER1/6]